MCFKTLNHFLENTKVYFLFKPSGTLPKFKMWLVWLFYHFFSISVSFLSRNSTFLFGSNTKTNHLFASLRIFILYNFYSFSTQVYSFSFLKLLVTPFTYVNHKYHAPNFCRRFCYTLINWKCRN